MTEQRIVRFQHFDPRVPSKDADPPTLGEVLARATTRRADPERLRAFALERARASWGSVCRVMNAEVPGAYRIASCGLLGPSEPRALLRPAILAGKRVLLLTGKLGRGKSVAAAEIVRDAMIARCDDNGQLPGTPLRWRSADAVGRIVGWDAGPQLDDLGRCWMLVLDDMGTETDTRQGAATGNIDGLIRDRCARDLLTIVTSNLTPAQLADRYGARLLDRFREPNAAILVCGAGPNLRGRDDAAGGGTP